jgi:glutathione S-transferase
VPPGGIGGPKPLDRFEAPLDGHDYLFGEFSLADVTDFPFVKYRRGLPADDPCLFHRVLAENLGLGSHPRVAAWVERVGARPRA